MGLGRSATALCVTPYILRCKLLERTSTRHQTCSKMCNSEVQKALPQNGSQSGASPTAKSEPDTSGQVTLPDSQAFKQKGNDLLKENKPKAAVQAYASALKAAAVEHVDDQERAVLLSNRSYAYLKSSLFVKVRKLNSSTSNKRSFSGTCHSSCCTMRDECSVHAAFTFGRRSPALRPKGMRDWRTSWHQHGQSPCTGWPRRYR